MSGLKKSKHMKNENLYTPNCIRTFTGKYVNVFEPDIDDFDIVDIAHALSNQCRFGGHLPQFYSVAQHCLLCSELIVPELRLTALMHDASEAYLLDIPSPIKKNLPDYKKIEDNLMILLANKFGFEYPLPDQVKMIDSVMLNWEWHGLMLGSSVVTIEPLPPPKAKNLFLLTFQHLTE